MKIRLKNFKGIKAGPELTWDGLDEIEIDFTGKNGLLAFSGENGGGKSTLIENLHHYPQLVSRGGALWQHVLGRSAEKEFISTFMGREYRSLIKMDADQGKQEGYLWIDGKSVVNGKITPYKEKVNEIFGQPFTYFRSQFCPQKSKNTQGMQIENMTAGVFRELLQQFLNLQRYAIWSDTSKQAGDILSGQLARYDSNLEALKKKIEGAQYIRETIERLTTILANQNENKALLSEKLAIAQSEREGLKETIAKNEVLRAQVDQMNSTLIEMTRARAEESGNVETKLFDLRVKYKELAEEIKKIDAVLTSEPDIMAAAEKEKELSAKIDGLAGALDLLNDEITGIQGKIHDLETQINTHRANLKAYDTDPENLRLGKQVDEAERAVKDREGWLLDLDSDSELATIDAEIKSLEKAAKVGDGIKVDCKETTCGAIAAVLEAKAQIPTVTEKRIERLRLIEEARTNLTSAIADIKELTDLVLADKTVRLTAIDKENSRLHNDIMKYEAELKTAKASLKEKTDLRNTKRQELARARLDLGKYKDLAAKQSEIAVAKSQKADREKALEENKKQGMTISAEWTMRVTALDDQRTAQQLKINEISAGINETADEGLKSIERNMGFLSLSIKDNEENITASVSSISAMQAELSGMEAAEKEIETVKARRESLAAKISRWRYLQIGCGKTGLQNLRIDGAAPKIIYNANRLLSKAYGARYAVRLETQNEDGKEDLQIKIIMENGQEVYLDDISGGQRAWNVQSLWLAMSLLNQEKSGRKYDYFCSDESDGALDVDNAVKYTALYRPFMAEGKLDQLIFISHKEQCRSMADHVLMFEAGKQPYWN